MQYSIDITTEQSLRDLEFVDAKIWISKNASLFRVFAIGSHVNNVYKVASDRIVTRKFILVDSRPPFVLKVIVMVLSMLASINPVMKNVMVCCLS